MTVAYLINRMLSSLLNNKTPFELLYGKLSSYSHLRSFDCLAYVHDHDLTKDKSRTQSRFVSFFGYSLENKGWRFYDLKNKKLRE